MTDVAQFRSLSSAGLCRSAEDITLLLAERQGESALDDLEESEVIVGDESDEDGTVDAKQPSSISSNSEGITAFNGEISENDSVHFSACHLGNKFVPQPNILPHNSSEIRLQKFQNFPDFEIYKRFSLDHRLYHHLESLTEEEEFEYTQEDVSASESGEEQADEVLETCDKDSACSLSETAASTAISTFDSLPVDQVYTGDVCNDSKSTESDDCGFHSVTSTSSDPNLCPESFLQEHESADVSTPEVNKNVNTERNNKKSDSLLEKRQKIINPKLFRAVGASHKSCNNSCRESNLKNKKRNELTENGKDSTKSLINSAVTSHKLSNSVRNHFKHDKTLFKSDFIKEDSIFSGRTLKEVKKSVDTYGTLGRRKKLPSKNDCLSKVTVATVNKTTVPLTTSPSSTRGARSNTIIRPKQISGVSVTKRTTQTAPLSCRDQESQADLDDPRYSALLVHMERLERESERSKQVLSQRHQVQVELAETRRSLQTELSEKRLLQLQLDQATERISALHHHLQETECECQQLVDNQQLSLQQSQLRVEQLQLQLDMATDHLTKLKQENERSSTSQSMLLRQVQESEAESRELLEFLQMEKNALTDALREAELRLVGSRGIDQATAVTFLSNKMDTTATEKESGEQVRETFCAAKDVCCVSSSAMGNGRDISEDKLEISLLVDRLEKLVGASDLASSATAPHCQTNISRHNTGQAAVVARFQQDVDPAELMPAAKDEPEHQSTKASLLRRFHTAVTRLELQQDPRMTEDP